MTDNMNYDITKVICARSVIFEEAAAGREEEPRGPARRLKKRDFPRDCRGLLPSPGEADIRPGCSQERDAESAAMLQGKLFTAVNKFLTTSPLVNKIKLLIVSFYFFSLSLSLYLSLYLFLVTSPLSMSAFDLLL
ncbi:hypothetical protein WN51_13751 [Melipona quadrifasciata]|uniref:Uncharacterized protein n=1 Tax=Melipona quadrifasciata TaxID=166423 RepID=A0A0M9A108_9HYME|nr:hypothetical protein WN51_13751 [Melipona quadrifasciata]